MKKIGIAAIIVFCSLSIHATTNQTFQHIIIESHLQSEYSEVKVETVPDNILKALKAGYPGAKIIKAYLNDKKEYKLEIAVEDQKATVYTDANGNWLK